MYFLMPKKEKLPEIISLQHKNKMPDIGCVTHETVSGRGFQTAPSPTPLPSQRLNSNIFLFNKY